MQQPHFHCAIKELVSQVCTLFTKAGLGIGQIGRRYIENLEKNHEEKFYKFAIQRMDKNENQGANQTSNKAFSPTGQGLASTTAPKTPGKLQMNIPSNEIPFIAKRPRNAYNLFVQSESGKIKGQFPHMRAPDIVKVAAERYNKLTPLEKQPYVEKCEERKMQFDQQQQIYGKMPEKKGKGKGKFKPLKAGSKYH